ncbi:MAG: hypothetical protein JXR51_06820 [Bacteroidales bacterium]|nr:hypothetical protein [Bacteroidales bacterium]MBN2756876.1 hypothetical protein [Bacteroidales bacterium]
MQNDIDREIDNPDNYKLYIFYFNKKDKRIIVPKQDRNRGFTINFGNFYTYLILVSIFLILLFFKKIL